MKVILFGTGFIYTKYKKYVDYESVFCIIDNNKKKNHTQIDTFIVYYPEEVDFENCDYVVIMSDCYNEMGEQLLQCGVEKGKIKTYKDLGELYHVAFNVNCKGCLIDMSTWLMEHQNKKVFLLSHSQTRTGAPIALMNMALQLRKIGCDVIYGGLDDGNLSEELEVHEIDYIDNVIILYQGAGFLNLLKQFDAIILCTIILADVGKLFSEFDIPIIWWLHESQEEVYEKNMLPVGSKNIHYYGGGKRVESVFNKFYPTEHIDHLLYCLPNMIPLNHIHRDKFTFIFIGWYQKRKGIDVLLDAVKQMPAEKREQVDILMVCPGFDDRIEDYDEICVFGELSQEELLKIYAQADVLVCPSRDDPMPIVVTQAIQNCIPCIVSDQVGQSEYFSDNFGGYIFENENSQELSSLMVYCIDHPNEIKKKGQEAYSIFQNNFSERALRLNIESIMNKVCR